MWVYNFTNHFFPVAIAQLFSVTWRHTDYSHFGLEIRVRASANIFETTCSKKLSRYEDNISDLMAVPQAIKPTVTNVSSQALSLEFQLQYIKLVVLTFSKQFFFHSSQLKILSLLSHLIHHFTNSTQVFYAWMNLNISNKSFETDVVYSHLLCSRLLPCSILLSAYHILFQRKGENDRRKYFVEIDHEIFSTVILSLPLIQEGQLSVYGERMCTILVHRIED